jgi:2,4-dienoyl-CoA reductase-like NADH-dependent reductase (Old Yellow Enzyme family)
MAHEKFPHLFSPFQINQLNLKNRIISTGHETHLNDHGLIGERMIAYHEARARGGAGLIMTEVALVHPGAVFVADPIRVDTDDCIPGYRKLAQVLHGYDCGLISQLFHPGREIVATEDGTTPVSYSASSVPNERFHVLPRPMPTWLVEEVIEYYGNAGARMREAGVDGVEIVGSHGYLPAQFLNPGVNIREDQYGGSFENRLRFTREVAANIRVKTDDSFVVGFRLSGDEISPDGLGVDDMVEICESLAGDGVLDYLSVVGGSSSTLAGSIHIVPPMSEETGYTAPFAHAIKQRSSIPVFVTGRINQPQIAEEILSKGHADMCGMTRAMIADQDMPNKALNNRADDIRACIGCNQACIGHFHEGYPISCIQNPVSGREVRYGTIEPAATARNIMIVGGGPAGMKAAAVAAGRGHAVTLYEKSAQLGGQTLLAQLLPTRAEFGGIVTNLEQEMSLAGVTVIKNTTVDMDMISSEKPDAVIVATGAQPRWPEFEGRDTAHVVDAWQVLRNEANVGASVVVADWRADWIGIGIAEKLAEEGCRVRLSVNGYMPGQTIQMYVRDTGVGRLHKLGVEMIPYTRLFGADEDTVYLQHTMSGEPVICEETDTLVICQGHTPVNDLEDQLREAGVEVHLIGDCLAPRTAEEAVLEGFRAGITV